MSGAYCMSIKSTTPHLIVLIESAKKLIVETRDETNVLALRKDLVKIKRTFARLDTAITEWRNHLGTLEGQKYKDEMTIFEETKIDDQHFTAWLEEANQIISDIEWELTGYSQVGSTQSNMSADENLNGEKQNASSETEDQPPPQTHHQQTSRPHQNFRRRFAHGFGDDFGTEDVVPIRIPPFEIPKFKGDRLYWPAFWQAFESSIDTLKIPPVQKLTYLISHLGKEVQPRVAGYAITNENYNLVVATLKEQYGDTKAIKESLQAELIHLSAPSDNSNSLFTFSQALERICRQLSNMKSLDKNDGFLINIIKSKLPKNILENVVKTERTLSKTWNLDALRKCITDHVTLQAEIDRCMNLRENSKSSQSQNTKNYKYNKEPAEQARTFVTNAEKPRQKGEQKIPPCCFCGESHWAVECRKFVTRQSRIDCLTQQKRCFRCLRKDHLFLDCKFKNCRVCNGNHHRCICPKSFESNEKNSKPSSSQFKPRKAQAHATVINEEIEQSEPEDNDQGEPEESEHSELEESAEKVVTQATVLPHSPSDNLLMSTEVIVISPRFPYIRSKAVVLFDTASQIPFIRKELVEFLNLPKIGQNVLDIHSALSTQPTRVRSPKYKINFLLSDGKKEEMIVHRQEWLNTTIECADFSTGKLIVTNKKPDILISIGEFWRFFKGFKEISPHFYHIYTTVGPICCGRRPNNKFSAVNGPLAAISAVTVTELDDSERGFVKKFWDLESIGIADNPKENDDEIAQKLFDKSVVQINGRIRTKWPWKDYPPDLPSNYNLAYSRLISVYNKLSQTPEILKKYHDTMISQLDDGIIEESQREYGTIEHFIPHHGVITHKLRIVFDASAHTRNKKSLNSCLYTGPNYLPDLAGMLLRFRMPAVAVWADIQAAFLQIELDFEDRNVTKFIWVRDPTKPITPDNLIIYRFQRVPFGVVSSPFLLAASVRYHLNNEGSPLAMEILKNIYVDNTFMPCEGVEEAKQKYLESKKLFASGQMNLREFISNSSEFNSFLPTEDLLAKNPKALGIPWDIESDCLILQFPKIDLHKPITRKQILSELASHFDPPGFKIPCLLKGKLLFQQSWDYPCTWDEPLPVELQQSWREFTAEWDMEPLKLPRRVFPDNVDDVQLHAMVDASKNAYCAAVYLVTKNKTGIQSKLIFAKNRLRPHKTVITIPRMELLAIVLGVRILKFVKSQLNINISQQFLWSDSLPVLYWINSSEKQPKFVQNRLNEIRLHDECIFRHIPTADNPADLGTRGISCEEWKNSTRWFEGPTWLTLGEGEWPQGLVLTIEPKEGEVDVTALITVPKANSSQTIIDFHRFTSLHKLLITIVFLLRYLRRFKKWRSTMSEVKHLTNNSFPIDANDMKLAENFVIRLAQRDLKETLEKYKTLKPFTDENGLIRIVTRIGRCEGKWELSHPILLPKHSQLTHLIIMDFHRQQLHLGLGSTLTAFLQRFWTPQSKRITQLTIKKCPLCIRVTSPPFALPEMPLLPSDRINQMRPFSSCGIDYQGPTFCRVEGKKVKCWLIIITCLTTRGVYLAPVLDLSSFLLIHILRQFFARRGTCSKILSDNGSQFRVLSKLWPPEKSDKESGNKELSDFLSKKRIVWKHIPEFSPWFGGTWERLNNIIKDAYKRTVGRKILDWNEVQSFTSEIEMVVNQRPITWFSDEADSFRPLRPVDFLLPKFEIFDPIAYDAETSPEDENFQIQRPKKAEEIRSYLESTLCNLDKFWEKFYSEYLTHLRERCLERITHKGARSQTFRTPKIGEVILIKEEHRPRNLWPIGRIIELFGGNNSIRTAKIKLPSKKVITRPISMLYPLEIADSEGTLSTDEVEENHSSDNTQLIDATDNAADNDQTQAVDNNSAEGMLLRSKRRLKMPVNVLSLVLFMGILSIGYARPSPKFSQCKDCSMSCTLGGVAVKMPPRFDKMEICCNEFEICLTNAYVSVFHFSLPKNILSVDYFCRAQFWTRRGMTQEKKIYCPAKNACNLLDTYWEWAINPECFPSWTKLFYGSILFCTILLFCCFLTYIRNCARNIAWIFKLILWPFSSLLKCKSGKAMASDDQNSLIQGTSRSRSYSQRRRNRKLYKFGLLAIIIFLSFGIVESTSETVSLSAVTEDCTQTINGTTCTLETKTMLTLLPSGQIVNLLLKSSLGIVLGEIELTMKSLAFECIPHITKHLRSYKISTATRKSCPLDWSCVPGYCDSVRPETEIPELYSVNHWPGSSYCYGSCSFFWCGCGVVPGVSCLFYKSFATPNTDIYYKLVRCQNWRLTVETKVKLFNDGQQIREDDVNLFAGMTTKLQNLSISLIGVSHAPSPIFHRFFLINQMQAALTDEISSDLFCSDEKQAKNFTQCILSHSACGECYPNHDSENVECTCKDLNLEKIFENPEQRLPLATANQNFRYENAKILAETSHTPIQIMINFHGLKLSVRKNVSACTIKPQSLKGCYNCLQGAEFSYVCTTNFGDALGEVKCGNVVFSTHCKEKGSIENTTLAFQQAEIAINCTINCGEKITFFSLEGHLYYLSLKNDEWNRNTINLNTTDEKTTKFGIYNVMELVKGFLGSLDWHELFTFIWSNFPFFISLIIIFIIFLFIFIQFNPIFRLWRLLFQNYRILTILTIFAAGGLPCQAMYQQTSNRTKCDELANHKLWIRPTLDAFGCGELAKKVRLVRNPKMEIWPFLSTEEGKRADFMNGPAERRADVKITKREFSSEQGRQKHIIHRQTFWIETGAWIVAFFLLGSFIQHCLANSERKRFLFFWPKIFILLHYTFARPLFNLTFSLKPRTSNKRRKSLVNFFQRAAKMPIRVNALQLVARMGDVPFEDAAERLLSSTNLRGQVMEKFHHFPIWTNHLGPHNKQIHGSRITVTGANLLSAFRDSARRVTVTMYFRRKNIHLQFPNGPCLSEPGGNNHTSYFPLELLDVEFADMPTFLDNMNLEPMSLGVIGRNREAIYREATFRMNVDDHAEHLVLVGRRIDQTNRGNVPAYEPPPSPPHPTLNQRFSRPPRHNIFSRISFLMLLCLFVPMVLADCKKTPTIEDSIAKMSGLVINEEENQEQIGEEIIDTSDPGQIPIPTHQQPPAVDNKIMEIAALLQNVDFNHNFPNSNVSQVMGTAPGTGSSAVPGVASVQYSSNMALGPRLPNMSVPPPPPPFVFQQHGTATTTTTNNNDYRQQQQKTLKRQYDDNMRKHRQQTTADEYDPYHPGFGFEDLTPPNEDRRCQDRSADDDRRRQQRPADDDRRRQQGATDDEDRRRQHNTGSDERRRRQDSPIDHDYDYNYNNKRLKFEGDGMRREGPSGSSSSRQQRDMPNFAATTQALGKAVGALRHAANVVRANAPEMAITYSHFADTLTDHKALIIRTGRVEKEYSHLRVVISFLGTFATVNHKSHHALINDLSKNARKFIDQLWNLLFYFNLYKCINMELRKYPQRADEPLQGIMKQMVFQDRLSLMQKHAMYFLDNALTQIGAAAVAIITNPEKVVQMLEEEKKVCLRVHPAMFITK